MAAAVAVAVVVAVAVAVGAMPKVGLLVGTGVAAAGTDKAKLRPPW